MFRAFALFTAAAAGCAESLKELSDLQNTGACDKEGFNRTTHYSFAKVCKAIHGSYEPDTGEAHACHNATQGVFACTADELAAVNASDFNMWGETLADTAALTTKIASIKESCATSAACMVNYGGIQVAPCFGAQGPDMTMATAGDACSAPICSDECVNKMQIVAGTCYGAAEGSDQAKGEASKRGDAVGLLGFCGITPATAAPTEVAVGACAPPVVENSCTITEIESMITTDGSDSDLSGLGLSCMGCVSTCSGGGDENMLNCLLMECVGMDAAGVAAFMMSMGGGANDGPPACIMECVEGLGANPTCAQIGACDRSACDADAAALIETEVAGGCSGDDDDDDGPVSSGDDDDDDGPVSNAADGDDAADTTSSAALLLASVAVLA